VVDLSMSFCLVLAYRVLYLAIFVFGFYI